MLVLCFAFSLSPPLKKYFPYSGNSMISVLIIDIFCLHEDKDEAEQIHSKWMRLRKNYLVGEGEEELQESSFLGCRGHNTDACAAVVFHHCKQALSLKHWVN